MKHIIFTIPGIGWPVPGFGLMLMAGFMLAIWWAVRRAIRSHANPDVILDCGFVAIIAGVVGCRAMYVIHYWDTQFAGRGNLLDTIFAIVDVRRGGLEFYGGFILCVIAVPVYLRLVRKVSIRWYLDIMAPSVMVGLALGRVGCFLNGCCWGGVCDAPWAVSFPFGSPAQRAQWEKMLPGAEVPKELLVTIGPGVTMPISRESLDASEEQVSKLNAEAKELRSKVDELKAKGDGAAAQRKAVEQDLDRNRVQFNDLRDTMQRYNLTAAQIESLAHGHRSLPVHPTQLYSTITALLIALLMNAIYWRRTRDGQVILALLAVEPMSRWLLEVIRADNPIDTVGFTISQFLAIVLTLTGILGLFALRALPPRSRLAQPWFEPLPEGEEKPAAKPA